MLGVLFIVGGINMSEEEILKEINESLKEISYSLKPKPKKPNYGLSIAWAILGIFMLYALYVMYRILI